MGFWDGSGISWTICKQSAPCSRQITTPIPQHSIFYRPDSFPDAQPTVSKHWRQSISSNQLNPTLSEHVNKVCREYSTSVQVYNPLLQNLLWIPCTKIIIITLVTWNNFLCEFLKVQWQRFTGVVNKVIISYVNFFRILCTKNY